MKVCVIGSGTWGTALSQVLVDNGNEVIIYGVVEDQVNDINNNHKNSFYFGDEITLSEKIKATSDLKEAVSDKDIILLSVPTGALRSALQNVKSLIGNNKYIFINTAKGYDPNTNERMSEIIREVIPEENRIAVASLIGPSHAEEVIVRDLTCICAVSQDEEVAIKIASIFSNNYLRVYPNTDEVGSENGVAMKNAIAIASGILSGLEYGDNARAALCTRGLAEMVRFGVACGGKKETYLGLTGLGDLIVTCYSFHSRNFTAGLQIGKEDGVENFFKTNTKTVEGIRTIDVVHKLAMDKGIELPIINALYDIVYNNKKPSDIVETLMTRPLKNKE